VWCGVTPNRQVVKLMWPLPRSVQQYSPGNSMNQPLLRLVHYIVTLTSVSQKSTVFWPRWQQRTLGSRLCLTVSIVLDYDVSKTWYNKTKTLAHETKTQSQV